MSENQKKNPVLEYEKILLKSYIPCSRVFHGRNTLVSHCFPRPGEFLLSDRHRVDSKARQELCACWSHSMRSFWRSGPTY